jgi:hypothetical protein
MLALAIDYSAVVFRQTKALSPPRCTNKTKRNKMADGKASAYGGAAAGASGDGAAEEEKQEEAIATSKEASRGKGKEKVKELTGTERVVTATTFEPTSIHLGGGGERPLSQLVNRPKGTFD